MQCKYVTLAEGGKHNRRSVADAIELLAVHAGFQMNDRAKISTVLLPLAAKNPIWQLCVSFQNPATGVTFLVWLPTSSCVNAKGIKQSAIKTFRTSDLNEAAIDYRGIVVMAGGTPLTAVGVIPKALPYELSDLDRQILMSTIRFMEIEDVVFRTFGEELDDEQARAALPEIRAIDFQRLRGLELPYLKELQGYMKESGEFPKAPSLEKIASTLSKCGMRSITRRHQNADA